MSEKFEVKTYIKLYRSLEKWGWYTDSNTKSLFLHCLIKANYKDKEFLGKVVEAGSFITSINHLSLETGLSFQQIRTCIKNLVKTNEIVVKSTNNFTQIFVVKWLDYQCQEDDDNKRITNEQQTDNKRITTTNKDKNIRIKEVLKDISVFSEYSGGDEALLNALTDFEQMRKSIKKPMSERAKELLCGSLDKLKADGHNIIDCLNQSIMNNYQGVFPPKKDFNKAETKKEERPSKSWGVTI